MESNVSSSGSQGSTGMSGSGLGGSSAGSNMGGSSAGSSLGASNAGSSAQSSDSGSLREELGSLKRDLDDLVSRAASLSDRELSEARDRMWTKFSSMRHSMRGMADQARTQLNQGMDVTSDYVKDKPLQSVAIAAGVGLLVGALMRGRD